MVTKKATTAAKKAAPKKAAPKSEPSKKATSKRKKDEEDEVDEEEEKVTKEVSKKRKVEPKAKKGGKAKPKKEEESEEEEEEEVKGKGKKAPAAKKGAKSKGKGEDEEEEEEVKEDKKGKKAKADDEEKEDKKTKKQKTTKEEDDEEEGDEDEDMKEEETEDTVLDIVDKRHTEEQGIEYLVKFGKDRGNEWVQLSEVSIPVPKIRKFEADHKKGLCAKIDALQASSNAEPLIYAHKCCPECARYGIFSAAQNGKLENIKTHVGNFPEVLQSASDIVKKGFNAAVRSNHLEVVKFFIDNPDFVKHYLSEGSQVKIPRALTPECLELFCAIPKFSLPVAAQTLFLKGNRLTLAAALSNIKERDESQMNVDGKKLVTSGITDLHIAALTKSKPQELPKPLNYNTIHANAFQKHVTPLHLAALNPNPEIIQALVDAGGDLTYEDDNHNLPFYYAVISDVHGSPLALEKDEGDTSPEAEEEDEQAKEIERVSTWQAVLLRMRLKELDIDSKGTKEVLLERLIDAIKKGKGIKFDQGKLTHEEQQAQHHGPEFPAGVSKTFKWLVEKKAGDTSDSNYLRKALKYDLVSHFQVLARLCSMEYVKNIEDASTKKEGKVLQLIMKKRTVCMQATKLDSALLKAIAKRNVVNARRLLTFRGGSELPSSFLETALKNRAFSVLQLLVKDYKMAVNNPELYLSPLHLAVGSGFLEASSFLIAEGANMNEITDNGVTVLMSATRGKHSACANLLVEKGVQVNPPDKSKEVKEVEEDENDADLSIPVFHNMVFVVSGVFSRSMSYFYSILKQNGAKCPQAVTKEVTHLLLGATGTTEYGGTTGKGSKKYREAMARKPTVVTEDWVIQTVEKRKAEFRRKFGDGEQDVTGNILHDLFQNSIGESSAALADTIKYLISVGVDVNVVDKAGRTILHSFVLYVADTENSGALEALKILVTLVTKANPKFLNLKDKFGYSALLIAAVLHKYHFLDYIMQQKGVELNELIPKPPPKEADDKNDNSYFDPYGRNRHNNSYYQRRNVMQQLEGGQNTGRALLHILVQNDKLKYVQAAIQHGANPNILSVDEVDKKPTHTPLICTSVIQRKFSIMEYLVTLPEVDVNAKVEATGNTMLHCLMSCGSAHANLLEGVLALRKGPKFDLQATNKEGHTLLHSATHRSQYSPALIRYLMKLLDVKQDVLDSVFVLALYESMSDVCLFYLDSGAKISNLEYIIKNKESDGIREVFIYVMHSPRLDSIDACKCSISAGDPKLALKFLEDPVVQKSITDATCGALLRSLLRHPTVDQQGHVLQVTHQVVDKLLALHPALQVIKSQDTDGNSALHIAIKQRSHIEVLRKLLGAIVGKEKEVVALPNKELKNCIHLAALNKDVTVLETLLKADSSGVNDVDSAGKTPIQSVLTEASWGIYMGSKKLVEVLFKGGADIFNAPKNSTLGSAISIATSYPNAIAKPLCDTFVAVIREINSKDAKTLEDKVHAALNEADKARQANEKQKSAEKKKRTEDRKKKMDKLAAIKKKTEDGEKKTLERQGSTLVLAPLASNKLNIPALGGDSNFEVYRDGDEIYDATLISTDLEYNIFGSNKYYNLQLLVNVAQPKVTLKGRIIPVEGPKYKLLTENGRVGEQGGQQMEYKFYDLDDAKKEFTSTFYQKTQNNWAKRDDFKRVKGCYNLLKKVYDVVIDEETRKKDYELSTLPKSVKDLLFQITDLGLLRRAMEEAGIDWRMMPLGRLDKTQLKSGHALLQKLQAVIDRIEEIGQMRGKHLEKHLQERANLKKEITSLSNEFYMLIPHSFYGLAGANHWGYARPTEIRTTEAVKEKVMMLESLREVGAALELLYAPPAYEPGSGKALLDGIYDSLCVDITELPLEDSQAQLLKTYARNTAPNVNITNIFKIDRWTEGESFKPWKEFRRKPTEEGLPSNLMLFHGTRATNVLGILTQGLRIAPPEAPTTGYMFGKGVYCANTFVKSLNYCRSHTTDKLMFVCEVSVGETHDCKEADYIEKLPSGKNSTKGIGRNTPDPLRLLVTPKGVGVPLGSLTSNKKEGLCLNYDEFIVYDQSQLRLKYILKFRE